MHASQAMRTKRLSILNEWEGLRSISPVPAQARKMLLRWYSEGTATPIRNSLRPTLSS